MFQQKTHMESAFRLISSHIRYLDPCASVGVGPVQYFGICFVAYPLHSTKWIFVVLSIHYIWHVIACTMYNVHKFNYWWASNANQNAINKAPMNCKLHEYYSNDFQHIINGISPTYIYGRIHRQYFV